MLYVSLAAVGALAVAVVVFAGIIRSLVRQQARERDLLINQLCSLAGTPWQPAPATERHEWPEPTADLVANPGQWPEDEL